MWKGWVSGHWEKSKPQTIYLTELRVEQIKSNLRKRPRKEVAPVSAIYSEVFVELSTQPVAQRWLLAC